MKRGGDRWRCGWVAALEVDRLREWGIEGLVLDLDNTLVSEDDRWLSPGVEGWLEQLRDRGVRCFVLSNGKRRRRFEQWLGRFGLEGICVARKPFPSAFERALRRLDLPRDRVAVVGDSWHTDGLGAWWMGCRWIQVASLPHPPRWWERLAGRWVQLSYGGPAYPPLEPVASVPEFMPEPASKPMPEQRP